MPLARSLLALLLLSPVAAVATPPPAPAPTPRPILVGYFGQWGAYDGIFPAELVHSGAAARLDQLNYAQGFVTGGHCSIADPKADLNLTFTAHDSVDGHPDPALAPFHGNLRQLILLKRRYPHLKILISLEGQAHDFAADAQPATRAAFVQSCTDLFLRGGFIPATPQPTLTAAQLTTPPPPTPPPAPIPQPPPSPSRKPPLLSSRSAAEGPASPTHLTPAQRHQAARLRHEALTLFDGIDLDWEYPHAEDAANFIALLTDLRHSMDAIRPGLLLTVAVGPSPRMYPGVDLAALARLVNQVGIMNYDYNGPWNPTTGLLAPLYADRGGSVDRTLQDYNQAGVPFSSMLMGVPFYGYGWKTVPTDSHGLFQQGQPLRGDRPFRFFAPLAATALPEATPPPPATPSQPTHPPQPPTPSQPFPQPTPSPSPNSPLLSSRSAAEGPASPTTTPQPFRIYRDPHSQAPWLYDGDTFWTYEDATSVRHKAAFALDHHLAGLMIWELGEDAPDGTLIRAARTQLDRPPTHPQSPPHQPTQRTTIPTTHQ